jgi:hypothetical protein
MRLSTSNAACAILSLILLGCTQRDGSDRTTRDDSPSGVRSVASVSTSGDNSESAVKPNFGSRFEAASELASDNLREQAFAKLAIDAAKGGDVVIAKKSLDRITADKLREDITYQFVVIFGKAGKSDQALEFARALKSDNQRQDALAKIANGDFGK